MLFRCSLFTLIGCGIAATLWFAHSRKKTPAPPPRIPAQQITQDAYVWQRAWTPAVLGAIRDEKPHFHQFVILAAEISLRDGDGKTTEIHPDYAALANSIHHIGVAIRIGPLPAAATA